MPELTNGQPTVLSRSDARKHGAAQYFTGKPCKNGHVDRRWTSTKKCCTCVLERDRARYRSHRSDRLAAAKSRYVANREVIRERAKGIRARNAEARRAQCRAWHQRNRDRATAAMRARYAARKEEYATANREWRIKNADRAKAISAAKRARRRAAKLGDRRAYAAFVRWARTAPRVRCYHCGQPTAPAARHLDHVIPLSRGGADSVANLCVSCATCNLSKRNKLPEEFCGQAELALV